MREPRAYGYSIYLMLAVPYASLAGFGYVIYRGLKAVDQQNAAMEGESFSADGSTASDN